MKILFVINTLSTGGAERVAARLSNEWSRNHDVIVVKTSYAPVNFYRLNPRVKLIDTCLHRRVNRIRVIRIIRNLLKEEKPDVIVSFVDSGHFYASIANTGVGIAHICSERNNPLLVPESRLKRFLRDYSYCHCDAIVFQTQGAMDCFKKKIRSKGIIIENPCPDDIPVKKKSENPFALMSAGRLVDQKNYPMMIEVMKRLVDLDERYTLDIYGAGELEMSLRSLISSNNLDRNVFLRGFVSNMEEEYERHSTFIMTTNHEGLPNALLEAISAGLPCVCTDCPCGGPKLLIEMTKSSRLVALNDVEGMMKEITDITKNYAEVASLAIKDATAMHRDLSISKVAKCWVKMFEAVKKGELNKGNPNGIVPLLQTGKKTKRMRVLEVISSLGPLGGGETFAVNFCREIVSFADLKVVILYTQNREHFIRRLQEKGIEPIILDKHGHFDFSVTKTIASIITDFKPNVIHTENNALISAFLAQKRVSKHLRAPVFHTMHLMPKEECFHPLVRIMYKHIFRSRGYTPVALTKKHANASEQFYHLESVPYVENGIDLEPFRNENPLLGRNYDVAVVGRFSVEKNHRFLIPAFKRLKERYPSLKVALVGDGDLFEETRALADRLGTLDYIEFTGPLENPSKVVSDSKIICLGSLFEANPLSLLEGMAAGCIAVSSDVGGVSDIVKEGKNGFTFECGNEDAFVSILEKVLNNTKDYVSMSDYNRTYANRFSMRNCAYNYFKLFGGKEG